MAAPAYGTIAGNSGENTQPAVGTAPASLAAGDLLLALIATGTQYTVTSRPTGFAALDAINMSGNSRLAVEWKIADGTEGASFNWGLSGSDQDWHVVMVRITGAHQFTPISDYSISDTAVGTTHTSGAVDVPDDSLLLMATYIDSTASVTFSNWGGGSMTERYDQGLATDWINVGVATEEVSSGSSGVTRATTSSASANAGTFLAAIIAPDAAAATGGARSLLFVG